jgi:solute carrier family 50 (sugar transporter)
MLFCFYLSPLSTLADVLKHRDSSSLTLPLCMMNIVNGTLWLVYGLVLSDAFIWVPNGVGALLGMLSTALCCIFPRRVTNYDHLSPIAV